MPDQVASLVLKVDSTQAKGADTDLDKLAQSSQKAEAAVGSLGASSKAAGAGVGTLRQAAQAARSQTDSIGKSAKETAFALRMLPAQLTDITVGLATGQSPFMVLAQQGGQLKDMFGGIGPAARAVGGYVAGLAGPFTLAAAGAAALAFAYYQGSEESDRYNEAILLTGNYAGTTTGQLAGMAERIGATVGTTGKAADALAKLVSTGKITSDVIEQLGLAAIQMEAATGKAADETIKEYERIADAPAEALTKLNDRYHFLTAAVYEQVSALQREGREQDAARLAMSTYAQALQRRSQEVIQNVGYIERAWRGLGAVVKGVWDEMAGIGRPQTLEGQLASAQARLNQLQDDGYRRGAARRVKQVEEARAVVDDLRERIRLQNKLAADERQQGQVQQAAISAQDEIQKQRDQAASKQEKLNKALGAYRQNIEAIRKANPSSAFLDPKKIAADEAAIRKQFESRGGGGGSSLAAGVRMLEQARQRQAVLEAQLATSEKLTTAQQDLAKFEQQIADIKDKQTLTAAERSVLAEEAVTRAVLERNVELQKEIQLRQEMVQLQVMQRAAADSLATDRQRYADELAAFGLGPRAREQIQAQQRLYEDFRRQAQAAARDLARGQLSEAGYANQMDVLKQSLADRLDLQRQYYADLRTLEADWRAGAAGGLADYADMAANVAESMRSAFSDAFRGAEDVLTRFVATGKLSFSDLANSIISDLARIAIRQSITGPLAAALGSVFGSFSSNWSSTNTSNPWSLTSLGVTGRAGGGSTRPGELVEVNEKGPELYTEAGRTFLMSGARGGHVTPLTPSSTGGAAATTAAPNVEVNVINQGGEQMTAQSSGPRFDGEQWVIDVVLKRARNNRAFRNQLKEAVS